MLPDTATLQEDPASNQHKQENELKAMGIKEEETFPQPHSSTPAPRGLSSFTAPRPPKPHVL